MKLLVKLFLTEFLNDNVSISISEIRHLLERKKCLFFFGDNFLDIRVVMTDNKVKTYIKYRGTAICIANLFVVYTRVIS